MTIAVDLKDPLTTELDRRFVSAPDGGAVPAVRLLENIQRGVLQTQFPKNLRGVVA